MVFCDPVPLAREALDELLEGAPPLAVLLTNANHERGAAALAKRYGVEIWAHAGARGHVAATRWFESGATLFGCVEVIPIEGFAPGECAFRLGNIMVMGDALIHAAPYGFAILPDKYCADPRAGRESLKKLLACPVEILTFAHGLPIVARAADRLAALLG